MIVEPLARTLEHLERLVAFDTRNPPGKFEPGGVFDYLTDALGAGFRCTRLDHGEGCTSLFAIRGQPQVLINVHLDTVPAAPGWSRDPHTLHVTDDRAIGLGACDIKGAAAALVAAAEITQGSAALLFSSDEEAGPSRCIPGFLERSHEIGPAFDGVIVSEPTGGRAIIAHRGIATVRGEFHGQSGHASQASIQSALHDAVRWSAHALDAASGWDLAGESGLVGARLNLGVLRGGIKPNMVASEAEIEWGIRPPPGLCIDEIIGTLTALGPHSARVEWTRRFTGDPLPAPRDAQPAAGRLEASRALARVLDLPLGPPVDFWTEAALFSAAGHTALVLGPGHIAQAHTADEWVALDELERAVSTYGRLFGLS